MTDNVALPDLAVLATKEVDSANRLRVAVGDDISGAAMIITDGHHEVHAGHAYHAMTVDTSSTTADYIGISFTTPTAAVGRMHLLVCWVSKAAAHTELIEAPDLANGSAHTAYNRARFSDHTSDLSSLLSYNSTVGGATITGGTVLWSEYTWVDFKTGMRSRAQAEWVLAASTSYAVKTTADAVNNAESVCMIWYEHVDSP